MFYENEEWGIPVYYFEVDPTGWPIRQIEVYSNGKRLKYSLENPADDFGMLSDQSLDLAEFDNYIIPKEEFDKEWNN